MDPQEKIRATISQEGSSPPAHAQQTGRHKTKVPLIPPTLTGTTASNENINKLPSEKVDFSSLLVATDMSVKSNNNNSTADSTTNMKLDQLPGLKDQTCPAGFDAASRTARTTLAQSVHAVAVDPDPEDPVTVPAAVLQTYPPGINAKNTIGTVDQQSNIAAFFLC